MGCWDGTVALWRLQPAAPAAAAPGSSQGTGYTPPPPATPVLLMHMKADPQPLRCVAWPPAALAAAAGGGLGRHVFMTAGHAGSVAIWDARWASGFCGLRVYT